MGKLEMVFAVDLTLDEILNRIHPVSRLHVECFEGKETSIVIMKSMLWLMEFNENFEDEMPSSYYVLYTLEWEGAVRAYYDYIMMRDNGYSVDDASDYIEGAY